MTERRVLATRIRSSLLRMGGQKARAASTRRQFWVTMLATASAAAAVFGLVQASAPAWAALKGSPCHQVREQVSALKVTLNKSRTLCFPDPFSTAVIGAPEIADPRSPASVLRALVMSVLPPSALARVDEPSVTRLPETPLYATSKVAFGRLARPGLEPAAGYSYCL